MLWSLRRGAGWPPVAGHVTTAVRLAPRRPRARWRRWSMSYTPDWERLADAKRRVVATSLSEHQAKTDLCRAVADKKIDVRVRVAESDRDMSGVVCSGDWVSVPAHLEPADFDWVLSRPLQAWSVGPPVGPWSYSDPYLQRKRRQIDSVELATADVQSIFATSQFTSKPDPAAGAEPNFNQQPPSEDGSSRLKLDSIVNDRSRPLQRCHRSRKSVGPAKRPGKR